MVRKIKKSIEKKEENYDYLSEHLDIMLLFRIFQINYSHRELISEYKDILREFEKSVSYEENITRLVCLALESKVYKNIILDRLIKHNNELIMELDYPDWEEEELIEEMRECMGILSQGIGINAQQMLLYYYSEKDFENKMIKVIFEIMEEEDMTEEERNDKKIAEEKEKKLKEEERIKNLSEEELELELKAKKEALIAEYEEEVRKYERFKKLVAE